MNNIKSKRTSRSYVLSARKQNSRLPMRGALTFGDAKNRPIKLFLSNAKCARAAWGVFSKVALHTLKGLTEKYGLSIAAGDLQFLDGRWYVTHAGLLGIAHRSRCFGIRTALQKDLSDAAANRWVFRATVYETPSSRGFVGFGDADPSNVSLLVHGAEMRVAETRAVNRALRKAYGIGLCSVEEIGSYSPAIEPAPRKQNASHPAGVNASGNGQPRLRDRLCLLIRQHQLNPTLVKRYAADFCGTEALRDTPRDLVESFINNLAEWAARDREGLLCKLNSYTQPEEVKS